MCPTCKRHSKYFTERMKGSQGAGLEMWTPDHPSHLSAQSSSTSPTAPDPALDWLAGGGLENMTGSEKSDLNFVTFLEVP